MSINWEPENENVLAFPQDPNADPIEFKYALILVDDSPRDPRRWLLPIAIACFAVAGAIGYYVGGLL